MRNIHLTITKFENKLELCHNNKTAKYHENIVTLRLKMSLIKFDIFFSSCRTFWDFTCFPMHISIRNIYLIIIKLANELDLGHNNNIAKSNEVIITFRLKMSSLKFGLFFLAAENAGI